MERASAPGRYQAIVVGGGNAGVSIAARLRRRGLKDIAIVEPRREHVYAPLQSHIAGGIADRRGAVRSQSKVTPRGVTWIQGRVTAVLPDEKQVELGSGRRVEYGTLIVAVGIEQRWEAVPGLGPARADASVVSNYTLELAERASAVLRDVRSGTVVFTQAPEPASCAGVAQKPLYLACDRWRQLGVLDDIRVVLAIPEPAPFAIPSVADELTRKLEEYGVEVLYGARVAAVRSEEGEVDLDQEGRVSTVHYDVLHAAPPQAAAEWMSQSGLAGADGFVDVDPATLRHRRWPDVWALGDAVSAAPIRSGGAIRSQAKIVADGITRPQRSPEPYDGYTETPFTVTARTAVFAEFDRDLRLAPSIPFWSTLYRERRFTFVMDRWVLPWVYWNLILKGRA